MVTSEGIKKALEEYKQKIEDTIGLEEYNKSIKKLRKQTEKDIIYQNWGDSKSLIRCIYNLDIKNYPYSIMIKIMKDAIDIIEYNYTIVDRTFGPSSYYYYFIDYKQAKPFIEKWKDYIIIQGREENRK